MIERIYFYVKKCVDKMSATVPIRPVGYSRVVRASQEEIAKFAKVST